MIKKMIAVINVAMLLWCPSVFAKDWKSPPKGASEKSAPEKDASADESPLGHEHESDSRESGGDTGGGLGGLYVMGIVLSGLGSATAIAGGVWAAAKRDQKLTGAIVGASGAGLGLVGGMLMLFGAHRESEYSVAPIVSPETGSYGLSYSHQF